MAAPAFVAAGAPAGATTGTMSVPWPVGGATIRVGDVGLLCVERAGGSGSPTLSTPAGFAAVPGGEASTGAGTAGTKVSVFWCRATATTMAAPVVAATTDHQYGILLTFRGCVGSGDPWDAVGGGVNAAATTSPAFAGVTTTVPDTLVVQAVARDNDTPAAVFSAQANAALAGLTELTDAGTNVGGGGGLGVWAGVMAAPGDTGTTTATMASGSTAYATVALRPEPAAGAVARRWDGGAWVPVAVKRWDGGAWAPATVKRWDGTGWV